MFMSVLYEKNSAIMNIGNFNIYIEYSYKDYRGKVALSAGSISQCTCSCPSYSKEKVEPTP